MIKFLIIVAVLFVGLVTAFVTGGISADVAQEKGYNWDRAFFLCFFLGITGLFLMKARPNLVIRGMVEQLENKCATH